MKKNGLAEIINDLDSGTLQIDLQKSFEKLKQKQKRIKDILHPEFQEAENHDYMDVQYATTPLSRSMIAHIVSQAEPSYAPPLVGEDPASIHDSIIDIPFVNVLGVKYFNPLTKDYYGRWGTIRVTRLRNLGDDISSQCRIKPNTGASIPHSEAVVIDSFNEFLTIIKEGGAIQALKNMIVERSGGIEVFISSLKSIIHFIPVPVIVCIFVNSGLDMEVIENAAQWVKATASIKTFFVLFRQIFLTFIPTSFWNKYSFRRVVHMIQEIFRDYSYRFFFSFNRRGYTWTNTFRTTLLIGGYGLRTPYRFLQTYLFTGKTISYVVVVAMGGVSYWYVRNKDTLPGIITGTICRFVNRELKKIKEEERSLVTDIIIDILDQMEGIPPRPPKPGPEGPEFK